jgi:hypothetical protein
MGDINRKRVIYRDDVLKEQRKKERSGKKMPRPFLTLKFCETVMEFEH